VRARTSQYRRVDEEIPLLGGNVATGVVRVGRTVRKPATAATPAVHALLAHLAGTGFDGSPRPLGLDEQGRQILEYVAGPLADTLPPMTPAELARVGALIRALHEAAAGFVPPVGARWEVPIRPDRDELICHHDLAPWNLVRGPERWVFIDWDGAGPGSRMWDLGYAAHGFTPLAPGGDPGRDAPRLRALVDGYRATEAQRAELPALLESHVRGMYDLLVRGARAGTEPWARLYAQGHADYWLAAADYVATHLDTWAAALLA
jgi:hypothetical protein